MCKKALCDKLFNRLWQIAFNFSQTDGVQQKLSGNTKRELCIYHEHACDPNRLTQHTQTDPPEKKFNPVRSEKCTGLTPRKFELYSSYKFSP